MHMKRRNKWIRELWIIEKFVDCVQNSSINILVCWSLSAMWKCFCAFVRVTLLTEKQQRTHQIMKVFLHLFLHVLRLVQFTSHICGQCPLVCMRSGCFVHACVNQKIMFLVCDFYSQALGIAMSVILIFVSCHFFPLI